MYQYIKQVYVLVHTIINQVYRIPDEKDLSQRKDVALFQVGFIKYMVFCWTLTAISHDITDLFECHYYLCYHTRLYVVCDNLNAFHIQVMYDIIISES